MISTLAELSAHLASAQANHAAEVRFELSPAMSARVPDASLREAMVLGLPMAQGIKLRIVRRRGKGAVMTAGVRYRDAVRMLAGDELTKAEAASLEIADSITATMLHLNEEERFDHVYTWICRNISYIHTAPGQKGYEHIVGAAGALKYRQANCQGFADVLYLFCGLCGITCEYRVGHGERRLHVWNAVYVNGVWREVDASKGARYDSI